jgi:hypothetical protein
MQSYMDSTELNNEHYVHNKKLRSFRDSITQICDEDDNKIGNIGGNYHLRTIIYLSFFA